MTTPVKQLHDENDAAFYPQTAKAAISDYDAPSIEVTEVDPGVGADLPANNFVAVVGEGPSFDDLVFATDPTEPTTPEPWITENEIMDKAVNMSKLAWPNVLGYQFKTAAALGNKSFTAWSTSSCSNPVTFSNLVPNSVYLVIGHGGCNHTNYTPGEMYFSLGTNTSGASVQSFSDYAASIWGRQAYTCGLLTNNNNTSVNVFMQFMSSQNATFNCFTGEFILVRIA